MIGTWYILALKFRQLKRRDDEYDMYNYQKAKAIQRTEQKSFRIGVEGGWNCNLNQIEGYKTVNGVKMVQNNTTNKKGLLNVVTVEN